MKNLETMGVLEMDALEIKNENGGNIIDCYILLGLCYFVDGFKQGAKDHRAI